MMLIAYTFVLLILSLTSGEVIQLDSKNFEHLTQAASGSTTGDWLVKFYAPWCGHCRKMEPVYESVAQLLSGDVNVARVDVTANRDLGTRFEIKGFPTVKLISKGKVYEYNGKRNTEDLVAFARGGYQIQEAEDVQPALGIFGEIMFVYRHAYKKAGKDLQSGDYFTIDVFLTFMPVLFALLIVLILVIPVPAPHPRADVRKGSSDFKKERAGTRPTDAAPATSVTDTATRSFGSKEE